MAADDKNSRRERAEQMRKTREREEKRRRNLITAAVVAVVLVVIAVAGFAVTKVARDNAPAEARTPSGLTKDSGVLLTAKDFGGTAKPDAVRLTIFEDLQCPVCKAFEAQSGAWLNDQVKQGNIEIEYRPIAFISEFSSKALAASMCVFESDGAAKWREYAQTVFTNQPAEGSAGVADAQFTQWAGTVGATDADSCIKKEPFREWAGNAPDDLSPVTENAFSSKDSSGTKFLGTPTVWVEGRAVDKLGSGPTPEQLATAIDRARRGR